MQKLLKNSLPLALLCTSIIYLARIYIHYYMYAEIITIDSPIRMT